MEKIYGATERYDGIQQIGRRRWELFYGFGKEGEETYQWRQTIEYKPTLQEIKDIITNLINTETQRKILEGMQYRGKIVWLSPENQRNIAFAYALAKGGDIDTMPTLKLGTDEDYEMYQFREAEEIIAFAKEVEAHIGKCISDGRQEREAIDWSKYTL